PLVVAPARDAAGPLPARRPAADPGRLALAGRARDRPARRTAGATRRASGAPARRAVAPPPGRRARGGVRRPADSPAGRAKPYPRADRDAGGGRAQLPGTARRPGPGVHRPGRDAGTAGHHLPAVPVSTGTVAPAGRD